MKPGVFTLFLFNTVPFPSIDRLSGKQEVTDRHKKKTQENGQKEVPKNRESTTLSRLSFLQTFPGSVCGVV